MLIIEVWALPGTSVDEAIEEALVLYKRLLCNLSLNFNGITIIITKNTTFKEAKASFNFERTPKGG